ncbi:rho guanine nucleotide exchange factor 25-like isoform X1 [Stomoxys calcitrans]|uniref:rho guanine nucleotide exchange factor 25-like isoform X1 n=1 Tax=Stomoxys calcitrans TaxID=35570 RepID=UPI0027E29A2D|nr:rho guanine nucleotide exchange factor 25-like isoform X1 [Stomoxys calcitrans]
MSIRNSKKLKKLQHLENVIRELIETEENYVKNLSIVVECYLQEFRSPYPRVSIPSDLRERKAQFVFVNIEDIYFWHKESFYRALVKHRQSPKELAKVFLKCESQFHMYAKYFSNKDKSQFIVSEYESYFDAVRKHFNQKLDLNNFLCIPIQRLPQYQLLLKEMAKPLKEMEGDWQPICEAQSMIARVLTTVNDFTAIQRINNFHGDIADQGKLVYHNFLTCKHNEKKTRFYVFLFTRIIIFTKKINPKGKYSSATYNYKLEIPMNKVTIKELHSKCFSMIYTERNIEVMNLICFGENQTIHKLWMQKINEQIRMQRELIADLVNPLTECEREVV